MADLWKPMLRPAALLAFALVGALLAGCTKLAPVVRESKYAPISEWLATVAVIPFYPHLRFQSPEGVSGSEAAALVGRFVSEALAAGGVSVITPSDLQLAFDGTGQVAPHLDPAAAAKLAAWKFGATAVLTGEVARYRDRSGGTRGSLRAASVHFELTLYAAPSGSRLWRGHFEETQQTMTDNPLRARQYPGRGTRWLTAGELARWGARSAVESLLAAR